MIEMKKSQGSVEFVIIASFLLSVFLAMIYIVNTKTEESKYESIAASMEKIANTLLDEIRTAKSLDDGYKREIFIPTKIEDKDYEIRLIANRELVVKEGKQEYVAFVPQGVVGSVGRGKNKIEKKDGIVYLQGIDVIINDRFYFNRAHDGKRMAVLKSDGQIIVTGTLTENSNYSPKSDDEFLIYDNSKTKVILAINLESGNIYIRGTLYPYEHEISASENDVIRFNDEYGSTAIKIDNSGNLYLKIDIVQNGVPN